MKTEKHHARHLLESESLTFAAVNGEDIITSRQRGIRPLLELIDNGTDLKNYSAADKVVGKAAAFLYVLLAPKKLHAGVISEHALDVLESNNINIEYTTLVPDIRNHSNTGFCPMETAVRTVNCPHEALSIIRDRLHQLS